jgi:hypothetical protein
VNAGARTVSATTVLELCEPEVPVTTNVYCPTAAVVLAVSVSAVATPLEAGFGENDAVTPLGRPETDIATGPVNPPCPFTYR